MENARDLNDIEIQQIVDSRASQDDLNELKLLNEDAELYAGLMDHLESEPIMNIPDDFSKTTVKIARRRKTIRDIIKKIMLYSVVSAPFIVLSLIVTYVMGPGLFWKILQTLNGNAAYIVFSGILIICIQLLDFTLVKNKFKELSQ